MKAIVQDEYGSSDVLKLQDIDEPVPSGDEVLVQVHAASVNPYDWHLVTGDPYIARLVGRSLGFGLRKPLDRIRGWDLAGTVASIGADVTKLQPGDEVFGWCEHDGTFAEYVSVSPDALVPKPANITFAQAAAVPLAGFTALQALRQWGRVQPGQSVLINGASGGVGTFAVQIGHAFGAELTGVCSTKNLDTVRALGADHVIDYTKNDFTKGGERYDLIIDSAVSHSLSGCRGALVPNGTYVCFGNSDGSWVGGFGREIRIKVLARLVSQRLLSIVSMPTHEDLVVLQELIESGQVTPVIDRTYPLAETPAAIDYLAEGHARGKVVVTV
jgi:NADPH:quinone reductase-like Zn-dependent oxidoreductase